ncbi:MAG TPA: iron-sulfur cluster repair protein YtfE [Giesbergeria sp.]|jgi:regulator of cell morphogenesis and NO signaling|uniref:iron-sulfur cluster repair protein YtfE n=1 Tax=Acidovorax sp. 210-6 TaxID=2699468 RepID=UPI0013896A16|nr:iron-sulfur cluster repair protein YtfE [Acidovorax sp. 210-6]MCL4770675.1 iron-sulfur cluster repair protein YtfE [Burkholderiaceae bacterium]HMZ85461.1 iron-sulfur cluster repair protein YtfE [Giesbergeria sp.]NCU66426.1 iron-sulfur cluster repair protein YtfE [Acidovorax sp. 210-6]HNE71663.1 iron-sulfur cluster repair protein YtfE [Giesbergeria sp.]HNI76697.1 iron-sulfur cluster repair protein YtfE [Giesbergeria sp.]
MSTTSPEIQALNPAMSIGQIAVDLPGATAVFRRLKLDFCCGGHLSLTSATAEKGLDLQAVLAELAQLQRPSTPTGITEPNPLIDHIVARYHQVHKAQLPELIRMAQRVESVHRANPNVPAGLASLLEAVQQDLLSHMHKEEAILFPMLKSGGNPFVNQPISVMRAEHVDHIATLEKLASMTNDATPPEGACNTWRALYAGIGQLCDDLYNHIHLENNVLFPQFEAKARQAMGGGGCGGSGGCSCS